MNRRSLVMAFVALVLASLACNFLPPPRLSPPEVVPANTPAAGAPQPAASPGPGESGTPLSPAQVPPQGGAAAGGAPSVVDYAPAPGDALLPGGAIEVYFDQAIDPGSTQLSLVPALRGTVSWPDPQTLRYSTEAPSFQAGQNYQVTVTSPALAQPAAFSVQSAEPLGVTRVFPAPGSENLPAGTPITVMFDRPVAASAAAPQPLELNPKVTGQGQWINSSTYQFQPFSGALGVGTRYTARIGHSLADLSGVSLAGDYTWQFSTIPPTITQVLPPAGAVNVPLTSALTLNFSQPMDKASVGTALEIETSAGAPMAGRLTWNDVFTQATFSPAAPWPMAAVIKARLASSALAAGGLKLPADYAWSFSTVAPHVDESQPAADAVDVPLTTTVTFGFNRPMDRPSTEQAFSLTANDDRVAGRLAWNEDSTRLVFTPDERLPYGARLIATLSQAARAADRTAPVADQVRAFTTVASPALQSTDPASGAEGVPYGLGGFSVRFASPMDPSSVAAHLRVSPRPPDLTLTSEGPKVTLRWSFEPDTKYTVTLEGALADVYGTPLGRDTVVTFSTAPLMQLLELYPKGEIGVYSARLPAKLYALSCGLPAIETAFYRIQPQDLADLNPENMFLLRRWKQSLPAGNDGLTELDLDPDQQPLPPGLYYVQVSELGRSSLPASAGRRQVVVVADANLTLKVAADEVLVWATAYDTGQPLAGRPIQILDAAFNPLGDGLTDANGLFRLPLPKSSSAAGVYYALSDNRNFGGYAFTSSDWSLWPFQASGASYQVYLYTDRPVYHPGQTIYVKGIVRQAGDARYQVPSTPLTVTVSLWDQDRQRTRATSEASLTQFGTLAAEFPLQAYAAGSYLVRAAGDGLAGEVTITVANPPQPDFAVTATVDVPEAVVSDTVHFMMEARSASGGVLPGAAVEWQASGSASASGTGVTDNLGRFIQPITATAPGRLAFVAQVTDAQGRQAQAQASAVVHPALLDVSVTPDHYIATTGQAASIRLLIRDWAGQPIARQAATVVFKHEEWKGGQPQWVEVGRTPLTTDTAGQAMASFSPPGGGLYQIEAAVQSGGGRLTTAQTSLWAVSAQGAAGAAALAASAPVTVGVRLAADQPLYHAGGQAKLLISSPYTEAVRALVTVERGRILLADVITVTSPSTVYALPVVEAYAPNVYVSVVLVRGTGAGWPRADYTSARLNLPVAPEQQTLRVQLTADKPRALPGDTVTFALTATDSLSRPVNAEFSLSLVDSAALGNQPAAEGSEGASSPADFFYGLQPPGVNTAVGLKVSNDLLAPPAYRLLCQPGGAASQAAGVSQTAAQAAAPLPAALAATPADFVDMQFWQGFVTTALNGCAQVTVTLPTTLTTWRMDARGVTLETLVGQATAEVEMVSRPLTIRALTPRFLVAGDQVTLAAMVTNNTDSAITAQVELGGSGVNLKGPASQSVSVPALGQTRVEWPVTIDASPSGPAAADLTFTVQGGNYPKETSRPAERPLPIYRYPVPGTQTLGGELDQAGSHTDVFVVPHRYQGSAGALTVTVSPWTALTASPGQALSPAASPDFSAALNGTWGPTTTLQSTTYLTLPIGTESAGRINTLALRRGERGGPLYYRAHLDLYPDVTALPALNRGLIISREVFDAAEACSWGQASCPAVSVAHAGDRLRVRLTLIVPRASAGVRVEDYLPAGAQLAVLPAGSPAQPSATAYLPGAEAGRFKASAGPDGLIFEASDVPAGTYILTYEIVAQTAGRFVVRPALAQTVDSPGVFGQGTGSPFTILP